MTHFFQIHQSTWSRYKNIETLFEFVNLSTRFDSATAKSFLSPEQITACTKTGELVTTIRVKAVKNAKVLA